MVAHMTGEMWHMLKGQRKEFLEDRGFRQVQEPKLRPNEPLPEREWQVSVRRDMEVMLA